MSLLINHHTCDIKEKDGKWGRTAIHFGEYSNIFKLIILFILLFLASVNRHDKLVSLLINHVTCNVRFLGQWKNLEGDDFKKGKFQYVKQN